MKTLGWFGVILLLLGVFMVLLFSPAWPGIVVAFIGIILMLYALRKKSEITPIKKAEEFEGKIKTLMTKSKQVDEEKEKKDEEEDLKDNVKVVEDEVVESEETEQEVKPEIKEDIISVKVELDGETLKVIRDDESDYFYIERKDTSTLKVKEYILNREPDTKYDIPLHVAFRFDKNPEVGSRVYKLAEPAEVEWDPIKEEGKITQRGLILK